MSTPLIRKVTLELEALPPDLRDLSLSCHPRSLLFLQLGGAKSAPPGLAPESALRLHPCRALPSAPVSISLARDRAFAKLVVVVDREE